VRTQLTAMRTLFTDITAEGRRTDWFLDSQRQESGRQLRDLVERLGDHKLKRSMTEVADAWDKAFALAPATRGPMVRWTDDVITPQERARSAADQKRFGEQSEVAHEALEQVKSALSRLNALERRTTGRG
jgi:hypothetical protein